MKANKIATGIAAAAGGVVGGVGSAVHAAAQGAGELQRLGLAHDAAAVGQHIAQSGMIGTGLGALGVGLVAAHYLSKPQFKDYIK